MRFFASLGPEDWFVSLGAFLCALGIGARFGWEFGVITLGIVSLVIGAAMTFTPTKEVD